MQHRQTTMFHIVNGNVTVNNELRKPEQSKDTIKQVRFEPQDAEELKDLCFDKNITFSDFTRKATELLKVYFDQSDVLLKNADVIIPMVERLSKNF